MERDSSLRCIHGARGHRERSSNNNTSVLHLKNSVLSGRNGCIERDLIIAEASENIGLLDAYTKAHRKASSSMDLPSGLPLASMTVAQQRLTNDR